MHPQERKYLWEVCQGREPPFLHLQLAAAAFCKPVAFANRVAKTFATNGVSII
jgi:hypothetical protein